jgi:hypothetical protein
MIKITLYVLDFVALSTTCPFLGFESHRDSQWHKDISSYIDTVSEERGRLALSSTMSLI